jgi:hypothetical protein
VSDIDIARVGPIEVHPGVDAGLDVLRQRARQLTADLSRTTRELHQLQAAIDAHQQTLAADARPTTSRSTKNMRPVWARSGN